MFIPNIFINKDLSLKKKIIFLKKDKKFKHILNVLRLKLKDKVILFNNNSEIYNCLISKIKNSYLEVKTIKKIKCMKNKNININLAQPIISNNKMNFVVQKSTELGVKSITPLFTSNSYKINKEKLKYKINHWKNIAISSSEQSRRYSVPKIKSPISINKWILGLNKKSTNIAAVIGSKKSLISLKKINKNVNLIVGPVMDFSLDEIKIIKNSKFKIIHLGPRILRAETSPIVLISIIQAIWGDIS